MSDSMADSASTPFTMHKFNVTSRHAREAYRQVTLDSAANQGQLNHALGESFSKHHGQPESRRISSGGKAYMSHGPMVQLPQVTHSPGIQSPIRIPGVPKRRSTSASPTFPQASLSPQLPASQQTSAWNPTASSLGSNKSVKVSYDLENNLKGLLSQSSIPKSSKKQGVQNSPPGQHPFASYDAKKATELKVILPSGSDSAHFLGSSVLSGTNRHGDAISSVSCPSPFPKPRTPQTKSPAVPSGEITLETDGRWQANNRTSAVLELALRHMKQSTSLHSLEPESDIFSTISGNRTALHSRESPTPATSIIGDSSEMQGAPVAAKAASNRDANALNDRPRHLNAPASIKIEQLVRGQGSLSPEQSSSASKHTTNDANFSFPSNQKVGLRASPMKQDSLVDRGQQSPIQFFKCKVPNEGQSSTDTLQDTADQRKVIVRKRPFQLEGICTPKYSHVSQEREIFKSNVQPSSAISKTYICSKIDIGGSQPVSTLPSSKSELRRFGTSTGRFGTSGKGIANVDGHEFAHLAISNGNNSGIKEDKRISSELLQISEETDVPSHQGTDMRESHTREAAQRTNTPAEQSQNLRLKSLPPETDELLRMGVLSEIAEGRMVTRHHVDWGERPSVAYQMPSFSWANQANSATQTGRKHSYSHVAQASSDNKRALMPKSQGAMSRPTKDHPDWQHSPTSDEITGWR